MEPPRTRYARNGAVSLAYQVSGEGPRDILVIPSWLSTVEHLWTEPSIERMLRRLGSFGRVIIFDRRGSGMSDRTDYAPLEEQMDDILAVLTAAGSDQVAVISETEGTPLACLFAATHPDRVTALALFTPYPRMTRSDDYPYGWTEEQREEWIESAYWHWGEGSNSDGVAPSVSADPGFRAWVGRLERLTLSPGAVRPTLRIIGRHDVRAVLPLIRVPTLIMRRKDDVLTDPGHARYVVDHVPGARLVELPGRDPLLFVGDIEPMLEALEEFLTGARASREPVRVLATVLFTDIGASTAHAARLGDRAWAGVLEEHRQLVRAELARHGGREVKTLGDGFLAEFDGPARAIRCAQDVVRGSEQQAGVQIRAGLHTGECERDGDDLTGIAVHIAARVMGTAQPGEVLVSRTVADLVAGSGIGFASRGSHQLKGVPGDWELYAAA